VFLERVRTRVALVPENLPHPLVPVDGVTRVRYAAASSVERFCEAAEFAGAVVRRAASADDMRAVLGEIVETHGVRSAVVSREPLAEAVVPLLEGVSVSPHESPVTTADVDLGITGVLWAVAATGSLVLSSELAGGRTAGLLPPVHVAVVPENRILPDAAALYRELPERFPHGLPSQFVLATGPSRSADIELQITVGVHGPAHVWYIVTS
jgi:L-lactate utilization protein LutC